MTPERIAETQRVGEAMSSGEGYQRELDVRRALQSAGVSTDMLTATVLISVLVDQFGDHSDPARLVGMFRNMLAAAHHAYKAKRLCANSKCRAGIDMSLHFDRASTRCIWCGHPFGQVQP